MDPERLRVAIVADAAPGGNGVGTYYADLAEHLAPEVARVALYAPGLCADEVLAAAHNHPARPFRLIGDGRCRRAARESGSRPRGRGGVVPGHTVAMAGPARWRANATALRGWRRRGWLRIALHPYDLRLRLAPTIEPWLRAIPEAVPYAALRDPAATAGPENAEREETRPWRRNTGFSSSSQPR